MSDGYFCQSHEGVLWWVILGNSFTDISSQANQPPAAAPGHKHTRKTHHLALQAKRKNISTSSAPLEPNAALQPSDNSLTSTLQSLVNSIKAINARLQSLENTQASSSSATLCASQIALTHPAAPAPAATPANHLCCNHLRCTSTFPECKLLGAPL